ncbi:unnamed protein product [Auanema sp. JU1783]|nr:unnamed protein product [Auanema sp. JU1783]
MSVNDNFELWRDCVQWLVDINVLRSDHKVAQSSATLEEFAALLKDGVLLCHLINKLVPNAIDQRCIPTQVHHLSEFHCERIICLFLDAAQKVFMLDPNTMFVAWELYCMSDFMKVMKTLSNISKSDICKRQGIRPFPRTTADNSYYVYQEENDIYRNLQEKVESDNTDYDYTYRPLAEEEDKIYDHFVARQDSIRDWKNDAWSSFQPVTKREHSIKELLDTEKNYVEKALNMIMTKFYSPLQQYFTDPKDHSIVFMNISALWTLHQTFYTDLQKAVFHTLNISVNDNRQSSYNKYIGNVFLDHKEKFIAYGPYCSTLDDSRRKLIDIEKSDCVLKSKIHACTQEVNENQFKLQDLLCLPMQRVLKYHLLLTEMLKATSVESPDRKSLESAKEAMEDLSAYVNEMKRDHEAMHLVREVERSVNDLNMPGETTLLDYGRLNTDCEVQIRESVDRVSGKHKNRHVFLFDKVLFICQAARRGVYRYKAAYVIQDLKIEPFENRQGTLRSFSSGTKFQVHLIRDIPDKEKERERNIRCNTEPIKHITLTFKNLTQMEKWITQFNHSYDNVSPQAAKDMKHKVKYTTFDDAKAHFCTICNKLLKGYMYQGYKCEYCDGIFHKSCLSLKQCTGRCRDRGNATMSILDTSFRRMNWSSLNSGEQVLCKNRVTSNDPQYLSYDVDDIIEVVQSRDDKSFIGEHVKTKNRGLVNLSDVRRVRVNSISGFSLDNLSLLFDEGTAGARIDRKESTILPRRPIATPTRASDRSSMDIVNESAYVGQMVRTEAERKLRNTPNGTFLVRSSPNLDHFAISISYMGDVKHTKVECLDGLYYFDDVCKFTSVVELVNYYKRNSLSECFEFLNTNLRDPYRENNLFIALHDFAANEPKFLSLKKGDIVTLIEKVGEERGWWKGCIKEGTEERVGFFPLSYVEQYTP